MAISRKVRLIDIAQLTNTSLVTVSKVLNKSAGNHTKVSAETVARIESVAKQLRYRPNKTAQRLAGSKSRLIGVLINANTNEFMRISYAEQAANQRDYRFLIGQYHPDMTNIRNYLNDFSDYGVCALLVHANSYPQLTAAIVEAVHTFEHVVFYDCPACGGGDSDYVDVDLASGVESLVDHLVQRGRRRIVYFAPYEYMIYGKYRSFLERERGYREGMIKHGLDFDQDFYQRYLFSEPPQGKVMLDIVKELLQREKPDAIITRNDEVAARTLLALQQLGVKCPGDIAVAGYDNLPLAQYITPALTTVDNQLEELSRLAVDILLNKVEGIGDAEQHQQLVIKPELIVRESTGN